MPLRGFSIIWLTNKNGCASKFGALSTIPSRGTAKKKSLHAL
jgi:hypothetical protein